MKKTLLASAVVVLVGATGSVWAYDGNNHDKDKQPTTSIDVDVDDVLSHNKLTDKSTNKESGDSNASADRSVALNNGSVASFSNAFNQTHIAAVSKLDGSVAHIGVRNIGNWVQNTSNANGGDAGGGGGGAGGSGEANSSAQSSSGCCDADSQAYGVTQPQKHEDDGKGKGGGDVSNGVGSITSAANGGAGGAGGGAVGGNGGTNRVSAGTFNMSSNMAHVGQSAAGIMVVSQNSGFASLAQQSVNVQSNLSVK